MKKNHFRITVSGLPESPQHGTYLDNSDIQAAKRKSVELIKNAFEEKYPICKPYEKRTKEEKENLKLVNLDIRFEFGYSDFLTIEFRKEKEGDWFINMVEDKKELDEIFSKVVFYFFEKSTDKRKRVVFLTKGPELPLVFHHFYIDENGEILKKDGHQNEVIENVN